ncbi:MAG TPA: glycosyltransferase family 4 protein [Gaiellaceae bacterium]|nr:glycosyltransferase family 4 protein [Gaiellaceae bacterium]
MRILVATDQWFPDRLGGVARVAASTATELAARGHDVEAIAPRSDSRARVSVEDGVTVRRVLPRGGLPKTVTDAVATLAAARRGRRSFDVALAHVSPAACGLLASGLGAPLVLVYHSSELQEVRFRRQRRGVRYRARSYLLEGTLALLERTAALRAQRVLVLSEYTHGLLGAERPAALSRASRVEVGVDLGRFSPGAGREAARARLGIADGPPLLVTVRRLVTRMGLEELVRAVDELRRTTPVRLAIVGGGSLRPRLEEAVRALGLEETVTLVGRVPDAALPDWYRAADLFVLPTVAYEGFGLVTAEALACGTPVVGTAAGATPELLAPLDRRLIVETAEPSALAAGIRAGLHLADPALRARCRSYACERFDWKRAIESWERALEQAVSDASRAARAHAERRATARP